MSWSLAKGVFWRYENSRDVLIAGPSGIVRLAGEAAQAFHSGLGEQPTVLSESLFERLCQESLAVRDTVSTPYGEAFLGYVPGRGSR
jgi:hypothetical protein